ncbi:MAG: hypothetical protein N5P05_002412 [Chroococcopsis gigantea SAG 12.99]|jgi:hypothetical protein|nr:carbohydrate porin [Chlorogloea purpurea SAG 13.99]MDV3000806.1 hypothetical protein [Chroococcopsis gigantea SAG 12.99]
MLHLVKKSLAFGALFLGASFGNSQSVLADESAQLLNSIRSFNAKSQNPSAPLPGYRTFTSNTANNNFMGQVTNVNQLKDVAPTDWAYEALRSLVERYGCIVGYRDRTYRGDRSLSRWEFAAGVNACLNSLERLIGENGSVLREDIDKLKRLTDNFATELAALGARVDNLENRVAFMEDHQFSTTTKLTGELITTLSAVGGNETAALDKPAGSPITDGQFAINYRLRILLDTSFNGEDLLRVRLQSGNYQFARAGSNLTDYNFTANTDNALIVNKLFYRFPVTKEATVWIAGARLNLDDISDPLAPFAGSFTEGSISFFGAIAPIYLQNDNQGPGVGALYSFSDNLNLSAYYSAGKGFDPRLGNGVFNGQFAAGTQLTYLPGANSGIGIAYLHNYIPQGQVSTFSALGFMGTTNTDTPFGENATSTDNIAILGNWRIAPGFAIEGWGMYTRAYANGGQRSGDDADIWNWKVTLAFPDLLSEGNIGILTVGMPPYAASLTNKNNVSDALSATTDAPWLLEAIYVFQVNKNLSVSPGLTYIINPANDRDPLLVGTLRTSFKF